MHGSCRNLPIKAAIPSILAATATFNGARYFNANNTSNDMLWHISHNGQEKPDVVYNEKRVSMRAMAVSSDASALYVGGTDGMMNFNPDESGDAVPRICW